MNHNINYLYNTLLKKYTNDNINLSSLISYLSFYLKKKHTDEKIFFNRINLESFKNNRHISTRSYNEYFNVNFLNSTQNIIYLDGLYYLSENLSPDGRAHV